MDDAPAEWWVYLLHSGRRSRSYIGIALDVDRRLRQHNGELAGGARSTRSGRPWRVSRTLGPFPDRSTASRIEYAWKQVRGRQRLFWQPPSPEE
jgi:predicted GIY-YIG superfamily endonuclease